MKRNKIVSKTLRPYVGALSIAAAVGITGIAIFDKAAPKLQKKYNISDNFVFCVNAVGIGFIAYVFLIAILCLYNNANKFANEAAKKYISKKIAECPDYDQFQNVLKKPAAIKRIAVLISNELRETEQKSVAKIMNKLDIPASDDQIEALYSEILQVFEDHATMNPEFMDHIYGALARESYDIYVTQKQKENAKLLQRTK